MKHTKGKWNYALGFEIESPSSEKYANGHFEIRAECEDFLPPLADVRFFPNHITNKEIAEANAKLIAAAPELLEACQKATRADIDGSYVLAAEWFNEMQEAIKKATS